MKEKDKNLWFVAVPLYALAILLVCAGLGLFFGLIRSVMWLCFK